MLNNKHMLQMILMHGARNEILAYVHRMLMVEAVNTTMGGNAQEVHDEVLEYILQVLSTGTPFFTQYLVHTFSCV